MIRIQFPGAADEQPANLWGDYSLPPAPAGKPDSGTGRTQPDPWDLWMQSGGHPDLYRRLSVQATEEDPLPDLPHEPGSDYCGVGGEPKPGHPHHRRCTCGRWYFWNYSRWVPGRPSAKWLREHGLNPGEFWDLGDDDTGPRFFEDFAVRRPTLLMLLRWLFRG